MVTIVVCLSGWLVGWMLLGTPRRVDDLRTTVPGQDPSTGRSGRAHRSGHVRDRFDVIIPARNEANAIGLLLADLSPLAGTDVRILVVDDHSDDLTAEVARSFDGVEVVSAPALPEGWTGKSWACHSGVEALDELGGRHSRIGAEGSRGLVFLDADVRLGSAPPAPPTSGRSVYDEATDADPRLGRNGSEVLELLVDRQQHLGGLVSVQPWHDTEHRYERLSALFNVLAIMGTAMSSRRGPSGAFGPVLVTDREDYSHVGGHQAVRGEVVEDLALAERYRDRGLSVELFEGGQDVRFRMYPNGLGQLIEGWTKNFATGAGATPRLRLLGAVLWISGMGSGAVAIADALRGALPLWAGLGLYAAFVFQLGRMFRQVGRFGPFTALLYPVLVVFFLGVFVRSLWFSHVRHSVSWRGRAIPVGVRRV